MKKSAYLCAAAIVTAGLVPMAAHAAARSGRATSCIDYNNNGVCDANDTPINTLLETGIINTTTMRVPGAPTRLVSPIGVVLGGGKIKNGASIVASGNVHINGNVSTGGNGFLNVTSTTGDIDVAPGTSVRGGDLDVQLVAAPGGSVAIGAGASVTTHGGDGPSSITISGNNVVIGDNASVVAQGYNASLSVGAAGTLLVGHKVTLETTGPDEGPGSTRIAAHSDIDLSGAKLAGRGVKISALASSESPARHIAITGGSITIPHGDGVIELHADSGSDGAGSNTLSNVKLNPVDAQIDATPAATVTAAARRH